jgi:aryl-alcohol dehydrogenase-like predicted oxidoreductase
MKSTIFGNTGLEVSRLALGTWEFGGAWGRFDEDNAMTLIRRARDLGFNFFDTAQEYGFGESERILGKALRSDLTRSRDEVFIATKGGLRPTHKGLVRDASPEFLRQGVESSLKALGVDEIDFYLVHWPDPKVAASETGGALADMISEGKIRHAGVSNYTAEQVKELEATLPVEIVQPPYHLFRREFEQELLPYCNANNIGVCVYGPLGHGLLTGMIHPDTTFADDDWRSKSEIFTGETLMRNLECVTQLQRFAADRGVTVSQLAIAWTIAQPGVNVAIVGAQHVGYLQDSAAAADVTLTDEDLDAIEEIMAGSVQVGGPYPEMHAEDEAD